VRGFQVGGQLRMVDPACHGSRDHLDVVAVERLERLRVGGDSRRLRVVVPHRPPPFAVRPISPLLVRNGKSVSSRWSERGPSRTKALAPERGRVAPTGGMRTRRGNRLSRRRAGWLIAGQCTVRSVDFPPATIL
jgi:hypothetical protein